jgi:hypothetical protein
VNEDWMERFYREAHTKHLRGVLEHRGGDETKPYHGDRRLEYCEEQLDSANYLWGMQLDGTISQAEYEEGLRRHFESWWWMQQVIGRE